MEMTVTRVQGVTSVRGREKPTLWIHTCTGEVAATFRGIHNIPRWHCADSD